MAYERAAVQNVLAAVNPRVFPGYWSVCADGQGFGYGNTYPSLDGHQMTDALLWLSQVEVVKANWDYVPIPERVLVNGKPAEMVRDSDLVFLVLPAASPEKPCRFEVACSHAPDSGASVPRKAK